jgi:hypothetical protein
MKGKGREDDLANGEIANQIPNKASETLASPNLLVSKIVTTVSKTREGKGA